MLTPKKPAPEKASAFLRLDLPLEQRKAFVRWHNPKILNHSDSMGREVGSGWHLFAASEFWLKVKA